MGYPGFWDLGNFLQGEKFLEGEQKFERLSAPNNSLVLNLQMVQQSSEPIILKSFLTKFYRVKNSMVNNHCT